LIEKFSLDNVGKAAGVFNAEKLLDLNAWHIRDSSDDMLAERLPPFLENRGFRDLDEGKVEEVASILKVRSKTLIEMAEGAAFCFEEEISYEEKADNKFLKPDIAGLFEELCERLAAISEFIQENLEKVFVEFLEEKEIKLKKLAQPLRVALTGKTASPGIFEVMQVLGKDRVIERVRNAVVHIRNKKAQG
ncbi:MAG: glutamate--tRNA ligase, partial [Proteobacteria bacterium]|nr:glutamate--tRNA ligase [Pseudomonadota bacterium]